MTPEHAQQHARPATQRPPYDDEIDLAELFAKIWLRKWWVVAITAVSMIIAMTYLLMAKPVYRAVVHLMPPTVDNLMELNQPGYLRILSLQEGGDIKRSSSRQIYLEMLGQLESRTVQRTYLPAGYSLKVNLPKRGKVVSVSVSVEGDNPRVADITNQYIADVQQHVAERLAAQQRHQIDYLITDIERNIQIEAELEAGGGEASELRQELEARLLYLQKTTIAHEKILPVTIDQPATVATRPIKPKKPLIMAVGAVLGLMLGLFVVLIVPVRAEEVVR